MHCATNAAERRDTALIGDYRSITGTCIDLYLVTGSEPKRDKKKKKKKECSHLAGLEPATFRLTAERANRLRHKCKSDCGTLLGSI